MGSGSIKVQLYNTNKSTTTNTISIQFKLQNTGAAALNLSTLKIRYYYTIDGVKDQSYWCDYAQAGSVNITGTFTAMAAPKLTADNFLEIGFNGAAGSLAPGAGTEIQIRFAKTDWSDYTQTNDYSFNSAASTYTDWPQATGYVAGGLQWGVEP